MGADAFRSDVVVVGNTGVDTSDYLDRDALDPEAEEHVTRNPDYAGQAGGFTSRR
jgi:hypothetical protein